MLQRDLLNVKGMVYSLTYRGQATLATVGSETLARNMAFYRHRLSPLFEAQMAAIIGEDTVLAGLLIGFHQTYNSVEHHMRTVERLPHDSPDAERARRPLPRALQYAEDYAQAALYLLPLLELGRARRKWEKLRRRCRPTENGKSRRALIERLTIHDPAAEEAAVAQGEGQGEADV